MILFAGVEIESVFCLEVSANGLAGFQVLARVR